MPSLFFFSFCSFFLIVPLVHFSFLSSRAPSETPSNSPFTVVDESIESCPPASSTEEEPPVETTNLYAGGTYHDLMAIDGSECAYGGYRCFGFGNTGPDVCTGDLRNDLYNPEESKTPLVHGDHLYCQLNDQVICLTATLVEYEGDEEVGMTLTPGCTGMTAECEALVDSSVQASFTALLFKGGNYGENLYTWPDGGYSANSFAYVTPNGSSGTPAGLSHIDICMKQTCPEITNAPTDSSPPSASPVSDECIGEDYSCEFPSYLSDYSLITKGDAAQAAKVVYSGLAVGGTLSDPNPSTSIAVNGRSYVYKLGNVGNINWNGGGVTFDKTLEEAGIDFTFFEWLAKNLQGSVNGNYKVVVLTEGGTFDTNDFNYDGQGEDNGMTLAVFNTDEDITLTKTQHGRQFGPSILAPFSHVTVHGNAGYVDGVVIAKSFETAGGNPSNLQLHGDGYKGNLVCKATPVCL